MGCKVWRCYLLTIEGGTPLFLCWERSFTERVRWAKCGGFLRGDYFNGWYLLTYSLKSSVSCCLYLSTLSTLLNPPMYCVFLSPCCFIHNVILLVGFG